MYKGFKGKTLENSLMFDCWSTHGSIKCNLKQKYIVGKSTNKTSSDDTGIAGTSLEVEVNLVKQLGLINKNTWLFGNLLEG